MDITFALFPKFYRHLSLDALADLVREVGLDTTKMIIRDGYWTTRAGLKTEAPAFVNHMARKGLRVTFATAGFSPEEILENPDRVRILSDCGIQNFRIIHFRPPGTVTDLRACWADTRKHLEAILPICEKNRIRAVYQLHHGTLITNSAAAYHMVKGLPPERIGIEIDPGNQTHEGYENWHFAARLLGDYLVAAGIKDSRPEQDPAARHTPSKGWKRTWCPLDEGVVNWHDFIDALHTVRFNGHFVFMPFYHENDPHRMTEGLRREVAYLRNIVAQKGNAP